MNRIETDLIIKQKSICEKYSSEYFPSPFNMFIAVALKSLEKFEMPINGLRHPLESHDTTNWYIWAGEYSEEEDFFDRIHVEHLLELCPKALRFLGLAPGWRFLFDNTYEDVWYDQSLIL